jgi:O-antigen/teichoic acid export membrane protein
MQGKITEGDVAKSAGKALLARMGGVVEVVAQPAYTLMFGLPTYGLHVVLWALVNLIENVADLGMTTALQRVVPQARSEEEAVAALRHALLLGVGPCALIAVIASLGAPVITGWINVAPKDLPQLVTGVTLFAWALPLWAFIEIGTSALRARRAFGPEIRLRIFWEQVFRLAIATLLWLAGVDTLGLLIAHLCSLAITAGATLRMLTRYYDLTLILKARHPALGRRVLASGLSVLPGNIVARLFGDAPPIILNLMLPGAGGAAAAGLYGIARKISSIIQLVRMAFAYVTAPLASAARTHDMRSVAEIYGFSTRLSTALALPLGGVMIGGAPVFLALFGSQAKVALPALITLLAGRLVEAIIGQAGAIQQVIATYRHPVIASFAGLAIAVLAGWMLVPDGHLLGMAIAVSLGTVVAAAIPVAQLSRHEALNPFNRRFLRSFTVGASLAIVTGGVTFALAVTSPVAAGPLIVAAGIAGIWLSLRYGLDMRDKHALGRTGARLRLLRAP